MQNKKIEHSPFLGYEKFVFPLLQKIPKSQLNLLLKQYIVYGRTMKLVQQLLFGFSILVVIHNFLIFSEAYDHSFDVQEIMIGIFVLFLIPCFVVIGILLKGQFGLRNALKKECMANDLPNRKTRKEFNKYVKTHIGGYGI